MTMLMLTLARALHHLAVWTLARFLNMAEPLVHDTGIFVVAQVVTIENKVGRALPQAPAASGPLLVPLNPQTIPQPKENRHDQPIPTSEPRPARRCHLQRRIGRRPHP